MNPRQFNEFLPSTALQELTEILTCASWVVSLLGGIDVKEKYNVRPPLATFEAVQLTGLHVANLRKTLDTMKD